MKISTYIPAIDWIKNYQKSWLYGDVAAGITVGVMLIPQGMAYAIIAGLPPVYGLYAALLPQIIYAIFGTSRQLAVGPVAMDSLLVAAGVSTMAQAGTELYILYAISIALLMGVIQLVLGVFKLGFLVNFLSKPIISGFTSAAAFIIGLNQLKHLLGISLERSNQVHLLIYNAIINLNQIHVITLALGVIGVLILYNIKKIHQSIPGALVVVILGTMAVYGLNLHESGVKIVGEVPDGLPSFSIPILDLEKWKELLPMASTIALIAFMESISVAKAINSTHKEYEINPNQELIALGLSNIIGALFKSYPTTGGFSRSAVNDQSGANTPFAAIIAATLIALTLLFLTPLFYFLPQSILAAIIMVAVFKLIDWKYPIFLWKVKREDFWMLIITFIITLTIGIKEGIIIGVLLSIIMTIYRSTQPHFAELGLLKGSKEFRNIKRFSDAETRNDILIFRFDAQLYFANVNYFKDSINTSIHAKGDQLKAIILDFKNINNVDATGLHQLEEIIKDHKQKGLKIYIADAIGPVRDVFHNAGIVQLVGENNFYLNVMEAWDCYLTDCYQRVSPDARAIQANCD